MSNERFGFFQESNSKNNENFYDLMNKDWRNLSPEIMNHLSVELARTLLEEKKALLIKMLNDIISQRENILEELIKNNNNWPEMKEIGIKSKIINSPSNK